MHGDNSAQAAGRYEAALLDEAIVHRNAVFKSAAEGLVSLMSYLAGDGRAAGPVVSLTERQMICAEASALLETLRRVGTHAAQTLPAELVGAGG